MNIKTLGIKDIEKMVAETIRAYRGRASYYLDNPIITRLEEKKYLTNYVWERGIIYLYYRKICLPEKEIKRRMPDMYPLENN